MCRFLALPESLQAGPVLYQMCTYLGAFPFPSLAPCILTREATLKVITIMTGRYKKILKRGDQDKVKLLFRSLAVFDRTASLSSPKEKPNMDDIVNEQLPDDMKAEKTISSHVSGFAIDEPANDDEEEDEDDLALAALDALDAIEVFKQDQKVDRKIHHAMIPVDNFKKLVKLLLLLSGMEPLTPLGIYGESLTPEKLQALDRSADAIVAAFDPDPQTKGIRYSKFVQTITSTLPDLFEPFNALFEHFLFSKHINLSKHRDASLDHDVPIPLRPSPIHTTSTDDDDNKNSSTNTTDSILNDTLLSQISTSLKLTTPNGISSNIFTSGARFDQVYSTSSHGTSLSSFSRQVMSWRASTMVLITGTTSESPSQTITLAAYIPSRWTDSSQSYSHSTTSTNTDPSTPKASLLMLHPRHALFPANPYNHSMPASYFSTRTGIALGCVIPTAQSRTAQHATPPVLGPVAVLIDSDLETCTFQHDGSQGSGAFVTDPGLERAQQLHARSSSLSSSSSATLPPPVPQKVKFDIDALEVWGVSIPDPASAEDEVTRQRKLLAWEEAEAARRRGVNFGGDKDGARALLEMAGIVGDQGNRSGGSM